MQLSAASTPKVLFIALSSALVFIAVFSSLYFWGLDHWVLTACVEDDAACIARSRFFERAGWISGSLQAVTGLLGTLGLVLAAIAVTMQSHALALQNKDLDYNRMATRVANASAGIAAIEFFKHEEAILLEEISRHESQKIAEKERTATPVEVFQEEDNLAADFRRATEKTPHDAVALQVAYLQHIESLKLVRSSLVNLRRLIYSEMYAASNEVVTEDRKVEMIRRATS